MNYIFLLLILTVIFVVYITFKSRSPKLKIGDKAPEFRLQDDTGQWRTLKSFGPNVVLYFYCKDDTSGCTSEACSLRDDYRELLKHGLDIVGISYDSPESHRQFKQKYSLPFTLLSDVEKTAAKSYGAYTPIVPKRLTFLIQNGIITHIFTNVDVKNHSAQIMSVFFRKSS